MEGTTLLRANTDVDVTAEAVIDGIEIINIIHLNEAMYGRGWWQSIHAIEISQEAHDEQARQKAEVERKAAEDPGYWGGYGALEWIQQSLDMKAWCDKHDSAYYCAEKVRYELHAAVRKAKAEGKRRVVIEDPS